MGPCYPMVMYTNPVVGIEFDHPSHWKLQQDGPPDTIFLTGEQINVAMVAGPIGQSCDELIEGMTGSMPLKEDTIIPVAQGTIKARSIKFESPGMGEMQVVCFAYKKITFLFQAGNPTSRFARELVKLLESVTFGRAEILFQPVTSVNCKVFYSPAHRFTICYPMDWSVVNEFDRSEATSSCQRVVQFHFHEEEGEDLTMTVTRQTVSPSVSTAEFGTLMQNQFCKAGLSYSQSKDVVADQSVTRFDAEDSRGIKVRCPFMWKLLASLPSLISSLPCSTPIYLWW